MSDCDHHRQDLGGLVLGGLDPNEAARVEVHLATCATCTAERDELAATVGLLSTVRDAPPPVPPRVRDQVLANPPHPRNRRLILAVSAAALIGVVVGSLGVAVWTSDAPSDRVPLAGVSDPTATGSAAVVEGAGGVGVEVTAEGLGSLTPPQRYVAWLARDDGTIVQLGELVIDADGAGTGMFWASDHANRYAGVWVTAEPDATEPEVRRGETVLRGLLGSGAAPPPGWDDATW